MAAAAIFNLEKLLSIHYCSTNPYQIWWECRNGDVPPYLADELSRPADSQARCRFRSASSHIRVVRRTRQTTGGDRSFPVAASPVWKSFPQHVITSPSLQVFKTRLKTYLFSSSVP